MIQNFELDKNFSELIFVGDLHWRLLTFKQKLEKFKLKNTLFFHVGDLSVCEYNLSTGELDILNEALIKAKSHLISIRGNHDDPSYFAKKFSLSNINLIADFTICKVSINKKYLNILGIGGAVSIDRVLKKGMNEWFLGEELPYLDNYDFLKQDFNLDIIVTHTAPISFWPNTFGPIVYDYLIADVNLTAEITYERKKLQEIVDIILEYNKKVSHYYYGHFHFTYRTTYLDKIEVILLDKEELLIHH